MAAAKKQQQQGSGGSALKRLKASLRAAGIVGQQSKASRSKKDRKRGIPIEAGKNDVNEKLKLIREEFNPFEIKVNRSKFNVVGRKVKGAQGKPTLSKQIGEENRKKTLLVEMKNKNHVGGIIDKRFGENNPHLTPEEKMLERFTREKQNLAKKTTSLFNLDDEELELTHYGQSLAELDDFDDTGLGPSSDEEDGNSGQLDKKIVSQMHFGGFGDEEEQEEGRPKSRAEIMKEIIAKSKMHKYERQLAKQEDEALRQHLDEELDEIRGLLDTKPKRKPLPSQSAMFAKSEAEKEEEKEEEEEEKDEYADYDVLVQSLVRDRRAQATDRTKTEEEIALEEKEKLEKAERARKRRMEGLDSESEDEDNSRRASKRRKSRGEPQGDDLEDDYLEELEDEAQRLGKGLTLEDIQNAAGASEDDEDEDEEDEEEEEEEESDYGDLESDNEALEFVDDDDDMNEIGANGNVVKKTKKKAAEKTKEATKQDGGKREIPYTFECPNSLDEFLGIMQGLEVEDAPTVVKRIRVLHHIKLAPQNKAKLERFVSVLLDYLGYIASTVTPLPRKTLDSLIDHLFELVQQLPNAAADAFNDKVKQMHSTMNQKMNHPSSSGFPDVEDLTILRCLGKVFPTSDLSHPVVTPAMLYMNQTLALCRIRSEIDIGRGLFLTLLLHEYQAISKRYIPEVINFLQRSLVRLAPKKIVEEEDSIPGALFPLPQGDAELHMEDTVGGELEHLPTLALDQLTVENVEEQDRGILRLSLVQGILRVLTRYLQLYASTPALVEVFEPVKRLITKLQSITWHKDIETLLSTLQDRLGRQIKFCKDKRAKTPIRMQYHRPIPIAQHLPKFEQGYSLEKHYDPDRERAELNKLKAQVKKEKKGAMRELRKDNMFMAREKAKERKQKDEEYNKMIKGVMSILQEDQAEKNRLEKEKRKA